MTTQMLCQFIWLAVSLLTIFAFIGFFASMDAGMSLQLLICKESKRLQRVGMILRWSMYLLSKSYRFPQNSQEKRLSFVWYILCFFSKNGFGKPRPHSSQIWLFGLALCMSACEARSVRVGKVFGQSGQENNFSLWCLKECCLRLLDVVNPLPHSEHKNGFSPIKKMYISFISLQHPCHLTTMWS